MNQDPLLSPQWYRIAYLKPKLRVGITVAQHRVRGEFWYVLSDAVSGRHLRFNEQAYRLISACDGRTTIDEIWSACVERDGDDLPTQRDAIGVFAQAFGANLFVGNLEPDAAAIIGEHQKRHRRRKWASLNPLAFRIPLWNPNEFLNRTFPFVAFLFSPVARLMTWLVIALAFVLMVMYSPDLADYAQAHMASGAMLMMIWLSFPLIKGCHEMAHAYTIKAHGGDVHEIGLTLLMLTPMPYVDASASNAMPRKWHRIDIAGAGIVCEAFLASIGLLFWLALEPGLAKNLAFATVFAGVISTLLVNGNPLLRFDGYFVFCDLVEVPNLATRSGQYWKWLIRHYVLRVREARFSGIMKGEGKWLFAYAPASWVFRVFLIVSISLLLAQWSPALGLAVLLFGAWMVFGKPAVAALRWLAKSPELQTGRLRAQLTTLAAVLVTAFCIFELPISWQTHASGVVWVPPDAVVRAESDGVVEQFLVEDGQFVRKGDPIARLRNDRLQAALTRVQTALTDSRVETVRKFPDHAAESISAGETYQVLLRDLAEVQRQIDALTVRAAADGVARISPGRPAIGEFSRQGDIIAHVISPARPRIRALVRNEDIALVRERPGVIEVAFQTAGIEPMQADFNGVASSASRQLPSSALAMSAGGSIELMADGSESPEARLPHFAVDLIVREAVSLPIGARVMTTFTHGSTTTAALIVRLVKQTFLRHFLV